jgi:putative membrane protein
MMKRILRSILINAAAIWLIYQVATGIVLERGLETLLVAAFALGMINLLIKPIINILLLPLNLITLGTFRWLVNVAALFLVTMIVPDFKILSFQFSGLNYNGIVVPALSLNLFFSFVAISFLISLITGFLYWLLK